MRYKAVRYVLYDDNLYRWGFNQPLLKCVDDKERQYVFGKIHKGMRKSRAGALASPESPTPGILLANDEK